MAIVIVTSPVDKRPRWYMQLQCKCDIDVDKMLVPAVRMICTAVFLYHGLNFTWHAAASFVALMASFLLLKPCSNQVKNRAKVMTLDASANPLKGKPRIAEDDLPMDEIHRVEHEICGMVTYRADAVESLANFQVVKKNTDCLFAKRAQHWGSPDWQYALTLEENVRMVVPTFCKFTLLCEQLGLDGFVYELPGNEFGQDVNEFGQAVRRVLTILSDHDPADHHCMDKPFIEKKGWVFEFNRVTFFITTFAPCYPETSSRHAFGAQNAYILFQPEISFAQHDLPPDTVKTDWDNPQTVRDKIRVAFKKSGRPYRIRETLYYPMAHDIVKPLTEYGCQHIVEWWKGPTTSSRRRCPLQT